jgi:hypothetical protein
MSISSRAPMANFDRQSRATFQSREQSKWKDSCNRAVLIPMQLWRTVLRKLVLWRSLDEDTWPSGW